MTDVVNEGVSAHRIGRRVKIMGGEGTAIVRPWTMKQRAELKPLLAAVFSRVAESGAAGDQLAIATLMLHAEGELLDIAKATAELPDGVTWDSDQLLWEDLPAIIQAIWETSVVTNIGGGIAGKAIGLLSGMLRTVLVASKVQAAQQVKANGLDASQPPQTPGSPQLTSVPRPN